MKRIPKKLDPEKQEELQKEPKEKGDLLAMLLASFVSVFLPVLGVLLAFAGIIYLIFLFV